MTVQLSQRQANTILLGIGLMLLSVLIYTVSNGFGKYLIGVMPVGEVLVLRGATAIVLMTPLYWRAGVAVFRNAPNKKLHFIRMAISALEIAAFYGAITYLPLANAMTFWMATPIYVTALSVIFLGERVGWRRWTAVVVGFVGVAFAMHPSAEMLTGPVLIGLFGGMIYACVLLATRSLRQSADVVLISSSLVGSMFIGLMMMLILRTEWVTPRPFDLAIFVVMAMFFIGGALCTNRSLKLAPASVVVPFQYTQIIWGMLVGYIFFNEVPEPLTLVGAALIIGAGIYIFMREQAVAKRAPLPAEPQ
ncbi:DMT family transporter [Bradyrhizobium sp. SSUT18]|uniref:DMT family transporter n=1 Tax=Bradyrhizobium sp. SSUT18 TaxID=3040602 RepID=UPI00244BCF9B|nr:DMT family transporter [Bradyrhizobium sp. SSUT18]MDH2398387.1 DMT family transporter [Bradyrhizobium sp. SSUT18]